MLGDELRDYPPPQRVAVENETTNRLLREACERLDRINPSWADPGPKEDWPFLKQTWRELKVKYALREQAEREAWSAILKKREELSKLTKQQIIEMGMVHEALGMHPDFQLTRVK